MRKTIHLLQSNVEYYSEKIERLSTNKVHNGITLGGGKVFFFWGGVTVSIIRRGKPTHSREGVQPTPSRICHHELDLQRDNTAIHLKFITVTFQQVVISNHSLR